MLAELGNNRYALSGVSVEVWLVGGGLRRAWDQHASVGLISFELKFDFTDTDAWLVIDEGAEAGGLIVQILRGDKHREWRVTSEGDDLSEVDETVRDSAEKLLHYHHCRGRQYGCWCGG